MGGLSMFVSIVAFCMRIFLLVAVAVEFVDRVIAGDFAFIRLAVVDLFSNDGNDCMESSRLGSCSSLDWGLQGGDSRVSRWLRP